MSHNRSIDSSKANTPRGTSKRLAETVGGLGTGAVGIAKTVGHGTADVVGGIAHGTVDVVGGIGKGAFTGGKIIAGGGVDLVTGVGDFSKE